MITPKRLGHIVLKVKNLNISASYKLAISILNFVLPLAVGPTKTIKYFLSIFKK